MAGSWPGHGGAGADGNTSIDGMAGGFAGGDGGAGGWLIGDGASDRFRYPTVALDPSGLTVCPVSGNNWGHTIGTGSA